MGTNKKKINWLLSLVSLPHKGEETREFDSFVAKKIKK